MSQFTSFVGIRPIPELNLWITTATLRRYIDPSCEGWYIEVPESFIFNGANVPWLLTLFVPRIEAKTISPVCLHDFLYGCEGKVILRHDDGRTKEVVFSRMEVEEIFYLSLLSCGVSLPKTEMMYR